MSKTDSGHVPSLHFALYQLFLSVASFAKYLPEGLVNPLFVFLRYSFLIVLGFAAWVRSFSDTSIGLWLVIGFVLCSLLHSYFGRPCLYPDDRCKLETMKEEVAKQWLRKELDAQRNIQDSLLEVRDTLERKSKMEQEAEDISEHWKDQLAQSERRADSLEEELRLREEEVAEIKAKHQKNLTMLSDSVESIKNIGEATKSLDDLVSIEQMEKLEHENAMLRGTIDLLTKQRHTLEEKHAHANHQIQDLLHQKADLEERLITREALENLEKEKFKEVHKIRAALGNAKGRLARVQGALEEDRVRSRDATPIRRRHHSKFAKR